MNSSDDARLQHRRHNDISATSNSFSQAFYGRDRLRGFCGVDEEDDDDTVSRVVPAVTVVLEGRSICQRISLHKHGSYQSLAKALRQMFVEDNDDDDDDGSGVDLSNAIPGHLVAYEDMENDLLLAGDLNWKDFVRVTKRIRILPAKKENSRKSARGA